MADQCLKGNDQQEEQIQKDFASFSSPSSYLPPLDQVTICSEVDSYSSDFSSVSSAEEDDTSSLPQSPVAPRAIFGRYWEMKGGAPALSKLPPCSGVKVDDEVSWNTYERALKVREAEPQATPSTPPPARRRIFSPVVSDSSPALLSEVLRQEEQLRKTQSTSALLKQTSCLRSSRFAAPKRVSSCDSSDLSVTFSPKVDVVFYKRPLEHWARNGWSDYFA